MSYTIENTYVGDGSTVLYSFTFEYIEPTDIEVSLDSVITTEWTFANATTVEFDTPPADGVEIRIYRNTTVDNPKAIFYPGSAIRAQDLNDNFEQILYVTQEADVISERAEEAAKEAEIAAQEARDAAKEAEAAGEEAKADAEEAKKAAEAAQLAAETAVPIANEALTTARDAKSESEQAKIESGQAKEAAEEANTNSAAAEAAASAAQISAANAEADAAQAVSDSSNALATSQQALSTANTADDKADAATDDAASAVAIANAAAAAVGDALLFDIVPNVASIPSSPSDSDAVEITDSTGIESFSPLTGLPPLFIGDPGKKVNIRYTSAGNTWNYLSYAANDPDNRYAGPSTGVGTKDNPSIGFKGDQNTGIFHPSEGAVAVTSNGTVVSQTDSNGVKIGGAVPSSPNITLNSDGNGRFGNSSSGLWNQTTEVGTWIVPSGAFVAARKDDTLALLNYIDTAGKDLQAIQAIRILKNGVDVATINPLGGAYFGDDVKIGGSNTSPNITLKADGNITAQRCFASGSNAGDRFRGYSADSDGTKLTFRVDNNGTVRIAADDTPGNNPKITLAASGSAEFAKDVTFTRGCVNGSIEPSARFCVKGALKTSYLSIFSDSNDVSGSETTKLNADGSAEFAGGIRTGVGSSDGFLRIFQNNTSDVALLVQGSGASQKVRVLGNGSAEFAGSLSCGSNLSNSSSAKAVVNNLGTFTSYKGGASTDTAFAAYNIGAAKTTASIFADGSAEFAGGLIELKSSGQISSNRTTGTGACFYGNLNGTNTSSILADGSASFSGKVTSASTIPADPGTTLTTKNYVDANSGGVNYSGASAWASFDGRPGAAGTNLPARGSLNIKSITKAGTGVYNVVFQTPMPNANYAVTGGYTGLGINQTANGFTLQVYTTGSTATLDTEFASFAVHATNAIVPRGGTGADSWADFNTAGAITASFNASVAFVSTGLYRVTFTTPMPSANYAVVTGGTSPNIQITSKTANGFDYNTAQASGAATNYGGSFAVHATNATLPASFTRAQIQSVLDLASEGFAARIAELEAKVLLLEGGS